MPGKEISEILKSTTPIPASELPRLYEMLVECKKETEMTKREMKKYDSMKEVMIEEITGRYNFYERVFSRIFAERGDAIKKDFEIIDEGMKRNDRGLVAAGVSGLSRVVASSPFTDMEKLKRLLEQ